MRSLTLRLTEEEYSDLSEIKQKFGLKTLTGAIKNAIKIVKNEPKNEPTLGASRVGVTSFPLEREYICEDSNELHSKNFVSNNKNKKNTAPLSSDWAPPSHLREDFCKKYNLVYRLAIELFREQMADENRKSSNWNATWAVKVKKGALRQVQPDDDELQPEDTMAFQLGNASSLTYLRRTG